MSVPGIITELQFLLSMYDKSQVHFDDAHLAAQLESIVVDDNEMESELDSKVLHSLVRSDISLSVRLDEKFEIDIRIPVGYPETENLSVHCNLKSQSETDTESKLNQEVSCRIRENGSLPETRFNLFELIDFCKETLQRLEVKESELIPNSSSGKTKELESM